MGALGAVRVGGELPRDTGRTWYMHTLVRGPSHSCPRGLRDVLQFGEGCMSLQSGCAREWQGGLGKAVVLHLVSQRLSGGAAPALRKPDWETQAQLPEGGPGRGGQPRLQACLASPARSQGACPAQSSWAGWERQAVAWRERRPSALSPRSGPTMGTTLRAEAGRGTREGRRPPLTRPHAPPPQLPPAKASPLPPQVAAAPEATPPHGGHVSSFLPVKPGSLLRPGLCVGSCRPHPTPAPHVLLLPSTCA